MVTYKAFQSSQAVSMVHASSHLVSCKPQGLISARRTNEMSGLATHLQQPDGGIPQVSRADCMCSKRTPPHTVCGDALCTVGYSPNNRESLTSSLWTCSGGVTE